jgi:hypothetical protein
VLAALRRSNPLVIVRLIQESFPIRVKIGDLVLTSQVLCECATPSMVTALSRALGCRSEDASSTTLAD